MLFSIELFGNSGLFLLFFYIEILSKGDNVGDSVTLPTSLSIIGSKGGDPSPSSESLLSDKFDEMFRFDGLRAILYFN